MRGRAPTPAEIRAINKLDEAAGTHAELVRWIRIARQERKEQGEKSRRGRPRHASHWFDDAELVLIALGVHLKLAEAGKPMELGRVMLEVAEMEWRPGLAANRKRLARRLKEQLREYARTPDFTSEEAGRLVAWIESRLPDEQANLQWVIDALPRMTADAPP